MRALVIGASGLVGSALLRALGPTGVGTYLTRPRPGLRRVDAADRKAVERIMREVMPETVLFPAGNPNVDWCERNPREAEEQNLGPLRAVLAAAGAVPVLAYSTDYVFDGTAGPYGEADRVHPLSVYGRLKAELERLVLEVGGTVVRTTGVFGWEPEPAKNFVLRLIASLRHDDRVRVPTDQVANPTYVEDLATATLRIAGTGERGLWHVAGRELFARDAFARLVAEVFGCDGTLIDGVPTSALGQAADRPRSGGLRCERFRARFGVAPGRAPREALRELRERLTVAA